MLHTDCVTPALLETLHELSALSCLEGFALGGGTSLALRFGHRLSIDLDFFTCEPFDSNQLAAQLTHTFPSAQIVNRAENTLSLAINEVKVDVLRHHYPLLKTIETFGNLRLLSEEDVAAMKLNAIIGRGAKKDFFDLHELLQHYSLEDLLYYYERKYSNTDRFVALRSLAYFGDAENDPDPRSKHNLTWPSLKSAIQAAIATA